MSTISYNTSDLNQQERFKYIIGSVGPRPICFASTVDKAGNVNLSPYSFFNAFSSTPPIMIFAPARNRNGEQKHTYHNVKEIPEVVINIVNHSLIQQQSLASHAYEKGVNEFIKSGLTQVPSEQVRPPRVGESPVAFECKVIEIKEYGQNPGAGSLVICEVLVIHMQSECLNDNGYPDSTKIDLVGRLGDSWYTRASGNALFEINKPTSVKGIGIDQLPKDIRESTVLTGNDLAKLASLEKLPDAEEVKYILSDFNPAQIVNQQALVHQAQSFLARGEIKKAIALLIKGVS